jgi:hypothetical protein
MTNLETVNSRLQYTNNTLFIEKVTVEIFLTIKVVFWWFELVSDLKVNFSKRKSLGVNVDRDFGT